MRANFKSVLMITMLILFASSQWSIAQEMGDSTQNNKYWKFSDKYFGLQASYMNLTNLNDLLKANGYPELSKLQVGVGLGVGHDLGPVLIGVDLEGNINFSDKARVRTGRVGMFVSTNRIVAGQMIVSPFVSFGLQSTDLRIRVRTKEPQWRDCCSRTEGM